jgi:hypothetical protein
MRVKVVSISAGGGECVRRDKILPFRVKRLGIGQVFQNRIFSASASQPFQTFRREET